jgi:hypothetical protein
LEVQGGVQMRPNKILPISGQVGRKQAVIERIESHVS